MGSELRARAGESSEGVRGGGQQRLTTDDALTYLKDVKERFKDDKDKYNEFLEVMKDFKAQKVDTAGVIMRVKELFKGHRNLILGFNTFLPRGYEITLPPEVEDKKQPAVEFDQAINYVNKIKARFQTDEHVYKSFLEILNMYRKGNKTINEVYQEVAMLFKDHSDLLEEFTYFLPGTNGSTPAPAPHVNARPAQPPPRPREEKAVGVGGRSASDRGVVVKKEKVGGASGERSRERDPERRAEKARKVGDKAEKEIGDNRKEREEGSRDMDKDFAELKPKRASARNANDAIRRQAGEGTEGFPSAAGQASTDDKRAVKALPVQYPFFDKVKARLRSRELYQEFLKCLNIFSQEIISRVELQSLVGDIFGKHVDLMEGFNEFLTHCENVEGYLAGVFSGRKLGDFGSEVAPVKAVKAERDGERERNREKDPKEREKEREREKEERDGKEREREVKAGPGGKGEAAHKVSSQKDKFVNKPISELDLSNCERCTPSYRLLPKEYPRPVSSHRTALGTSVLNDSWVSVTSGSEDYSFKHMRKNQYEESLFRCEDDRFELDMLLESTSVTGKLVGEYTAKLEVDHGKGESLPAVEDFLSAIHLRTIERIYGDHGLDILEALRKNPSRAMPVLHSRLVQKEEEWTQCREEMNKVWSEVYAKNVYKALDHRSFYFRQQDKKALSTKGLLAEIKEVNEKRRREDDTMLAIAAGNRRPLVADLRYEFGDASIHDDIYEIIKYSSEEISSSADHTEKIMRMWRTFLEPMLGISPRGEGAEEVEEGPKSKGLVEESVRGETISPQGGDVDAVGELAGSERADGGDANGDNESVAVVGDGLGGETGASGEDAERRGGVDEVRVMDMDVGAAEGTAARTEGSGWLQVENGGGRESKGVAERGERSIEWHEGEGRSRRGGVVGGNGSSGRGTVAKEEGEMSPTSEHGDRKKVNSSSRHGAEEDRTVKLGVDDEENGEGVCGTEMDHDQDADDEGEVSAQKSSEDSDPSSSEQSGGEQSEHEEEEGEHDEKVESEGEAEGMDGDDRDEDGNVLLTTESAYLHCKPLSVYPSALASIDGSVSKRVERVFYGNDMLYVLLRLYQTLYERILSAKVNAEVASKKKSSDGSAAPNLYSRFVQVLYGLLDGSMDNSNFEDECRAIIGTQSYVLFTLDKLIFKLVKQLQSAATDDGVQKLLTLNTYEHGREAVDAVYYADACVVQHDERLCRFEYRTNTGELTIQLMESSEKLDVSSHALGSPFQKYLDEFTMCASTEKKNDALFIKRNMARTGPEEPDYQVINGLEIKISCRTYKVSYVLDTEDLFWRRRRRSQSSQERKERAESQRSGRFAQWLRNRSKESVDDASESSLSHME